MVVALLHQVDGEVGVAASVAAVDPHDNPVPDSCGPRYNIGRRVGETLYPCHAGGLHE
ncbi:hypothetical protein [Amycolatopsis sp. cmx-11-51]|uniref:hypothetical protein n=1 Tax=Amycolatopsis sp. cmx-11-51 TaxID=2785797 RepID=UPI0039E6141E